MYIYIYIYIYIYNMAALAAGLPGGSGPLRPSPTRLPDFLRARSMHKRLTHPRHSDYGDNSMYTVCAT